MTSYTLDILKAGGFTVAVHPMMVEDVKTAEAADPGCWLDMRTTLDRVNDGTCRSDDWNAPLDRNYVDLGEIKRKRERRLYRLYVHASRSEPGIVTLLHFDWKPPGKAGLKTQNSQIDVAFNRLLAPPG